MVDHEANGNNWHSVSVSFKTIHQNMVYLIAEVPVTKYDKLEA